MDENTLEPDETVETPVNETPAEDQPAEPTVEADEEVPTEGTVTEEVSANE